MNTLVTIAACLLASSVLQGLGFYLYSAFYKRKHLRAFEVATNLSAAAQTAFNDQTFVYTSPTKQETGQKTSLPFDTFKFKFSGTSTATTKPNLPAISIKPQSAYTKQSAK